MGKTWNDLLVVVGSDVLWRKNVNGKWATVIVLLFLFIWHTLKRSKSFSSSKRVGSSTSQIIRVSPTSETRIADIVSDSDLRNLMNNLDGIYEEEVKWDDVVDRKNNMLSYTAKCCKPQDGPLKYMSVTIFENCSVELLRDFYMDNEYRVQWDKTMVDHVQLQVDDTNGIEIGRTVKKFPLLTPREYVLAWRLWEGKEKTYYCFTRECEHSMAPRQKKYVRVGYFRSGWRIRKVPGRNACEIKMVHQEDAGLNVEMAKLVFSKGIWSYVCKMDAALCKYTSVRNPQSSSIITAVTCMQKVPPELDTTTITNCQPSERSSTSGFAIQETKVRGKTLMRRPSKKMVANGLLLLGGVICLSRGHSSLGAKVAMACILKKLTEHTAVSGQAGRS